MAYQFLLDAILILVPVLYIKFHLGLDPAKELGLQKPKLKQAAINSIIILLGLVVTAMVCSLIIQLFLSAEIAVLETAKQAMLSNIPLLAWLLFVRVIGEEIFFRGFLVPRIGIFWSALLFGLMHIGYGIIISVIGAFAMGLILAYAFKKTGSLYPNIIAHAMYNLLALVI